MLRDTIKNFFNTEELVELLKSSSHITSSKKIELWNELKIRSVAKIVALIYTFPLLIVSFKIHRSVLVHELLKGAQSKNSSNNGLFSNFTSYISEIYGAKTEKQVDSTTVQQQFSNSARYFTSDGVFLLLKLIRQLVIEFTDCSKLMDVIYLTDFRLIIEKIESKLYTLLDIRNVVAPIPEMDKSSAFYSLLNQYVSALSSLRCKSLLENFQTQYLEAAFNFIDANKYEDHECTLRFAKLIPLLTKAFQKISLNRTGIFESVINSSDLHQFSLLVFNCASDLSYIT